jgi:Nif-specific regulatory protein
MQNRAVDPRVSILKDISPLLTSVLDTDSVLEMIIESVTRLMEAKASSLLLVNKSRNKLYFQIATGEAKEEVKKFEIDMGQGIAGHVASVHCLRAHKKRAGCYWRHPDYRP